VKVSWDEPSDHHVKNICVHMKNRLVIICDAYCEKTIGPIHALNVSNSLKMPFLLFSYKMLDGVIELCFETHQHKHWHMLSIFW
jgi:hypothetical protein